MGSDPFTGDIERLKDERAAFRRRVGDWRIFFDVDIEVRWQTRDRIEFRSTS